MCDHFECRVAILVSADDFENPKGSQPSVVCLTKLNRTAYGRAERFRSSRKYSEQSSVVGMEAFAVELLAVSTFCSIRRVFLSDAACGLSPFHGIHLERAPQPRNLSRISIC